jgi:hypothetical protein
VGLPPFAAWSVATQDAWPFFLVPVAILLAILGYRRTTPPLAWPRRAPLVVLRALAYSCLLLILASPVLDRQRREPQRARIAVLVDESASMASVDAPGGPSRLGAARTALTAITAGLADRPVDLEVVPFATAPAAALTPQAYLAAESAPTGAGTDVLQALQSTTERLAAENLQALVVLSDGRPTHGGLDPNAVTGLGRPVFTVGFGDTLPARDLAIGRCDYSPVAYVESEAAIDVRIESSGFRGQGTMLRLLHEGHEIFSRRLAFDQDNGRVAVQIPLRLETPGRQRYRLELQPLPGEFTDKNNAREISIEVLKNRIRVLVLAARPDWDVAFLARTMRDDPNVRVTVAHLDGGGRWVGGDAERDLTLPSGNGWMQDYDLYVVAAAGREVPGTAWKDLATAVERGKGLLVLAGRESVLGQAAGFEPLAAILPVARPRSRAPQYTAARPRIAMAGRSHPVSAAWSEIADASGTLAALPPVLGQQADLTAKPGAQVLLSSDADLPLLVVGRQGEGQTAVLNGFPFWRWGLTDHEPVRRACISFVGSLVRWLVQPRDVQPVQITTPKTVYESGESVEFLAHVLDPQFAPLDDAEVRVEVRPAGDPSHPAATLLLQRRAGHPGDYGAALPGLGPGEYEVTATATRQGTALGRASLRFTVDAYSVEFANTSQDADFLRELASRSGGRYTPASGVAALANVLPQATRTVVLRSEVDLWNTTPLFVLFVALLGAEWLLRKRLGLL